MKMLNLTGIVFDNDTFNRKGWVWSPEKLKLIKDVTWICPISINKTWTSNDGYLVIIDDLWIFKSGYIWNGATGVPSGGVDVTPELPVISLTDKPVPTLWKATLIHDAGCAGTNDRTFPFKRFIIDCFFYNESKKANFKWSLLYYYGVRIFGKPLNNLMCIWQKIKATWKER